MTKLNAPHALFVLLQSQGANICSGFISFLFFVNRDIFLLFSLCLQPVRFSSERRSERGG